MKSSSLMKKPLYWLVIIVSLTILILVLCFNRIKVGSSIQSYWLWAGITDDLVPKKSILYIYQGDFRTHKNQLNFQHQGLYPYPISCTQCYLVYRFNRSLPDAKQVAAVFLLDAKKWQRHHVVIRGLQIDHDSPSRNLDRYSEFLVELRKALPAEYELDITGLCDWINTGSMQALKKISTVTKDIVFQLYDGRHPLPDAAHYIKVLKNYVFPFRLGLLKSSPMQDEVKSLKENNYFLGVIYFIQKD